MQARKIPLEDIRRKALITNKDLLKINSDLFYDNLTGNEIKLELKKIHEDSEGEIEEIRARLKMFQRKRHWMVWHDHSTLSNYGHMLFSLREVYDPAIHLSDEEAKAKLGREVDVQASIEKPHLYILGQSGSSIADQMKFVPTRQDDLRNLKQPIKTEEGIDVSDEMRFMNGDNPSIQFESGNQHGGHKGCSGCDGDLNLSYDLEYMHNRKYCTLEERQKLVLAGIEGKKGQLHPFKDLKVDALKAELVARGFADINKTKPELTKDLNDILGGSTRTPALLFGEGELTVESLNLENYEVLYFEALHCSMNQIKNVLEELPHHISDIDTLIKLKEILAVQLNKEKMRGVDYRKTLIFLTIALHQTATRDVRILLMTLCEMVEIFYCQEKRRSPRLVLRLHNLCWRHAIQCRRVLTPTRALTCRKLFGLYFHACVSHSAFLLRLVSHRSTNAEMFERLFEELTDVTRKTWNRKIEDLARNAVLHMQAKKSTQGNAVMKQEKEISNIGRALPKLGNTILPRDLIHTHAGHWEAHLKSIADFLLPGEGVWWKVTDGECIEFFDGPDEPDFREQGPPLHHFRSSNIKKEHSYLKSCWDQCLADEIQIPATKLKDNYGKWTTSGKLLSLIDDEEETQSDQEMPPAEPFDSNDEPETPAEPFDSNDEPEAPAEVELEEEWTSDEPSNDSKQQPELGCEAAHDSVSPQALVIQSSHEHDEPPSKKPRTENGSENLSSKTAKALAQVLGKTKEVITYEKLKNNVAKNPGSKYHKEQFLNHLAHIQVQVLKKYKQIHKEIEEWSSSFKDSKKKPPTERDLKTDPDILSTWKNSKIAKELLRVWKITVHMG